MPERTFKLGVYTRYGPVFEGEVVSLRLPASEGSLGVRFGRAPLLTRLQIGLLEYVSPDGKEDRIAVSGGFAEVSAAGVTLLCPSAEPLQAIDADRAQRALERARRRLESLRAGHAQEEIDEQRARLALQRALNRLRAVGKS